MTDKTHKSVKQVGDNGAWKDLGGDIVVSVSTVSAWSHARDAHDRQRWGQIPAGTILLMTKIVSQHRCVVLWNETLWETDTNKLFYIEPGDTLEDKRICITGKLEHARDYYATLITYKKGIFKKSVTRSVDLLVTGKNVGQRKIDKAKRFGIDMISEDEFMKMAGLRSI